MIRLENKRLFLMSTRYDIDTYKEKQMYHKDKSDHYYSSPCVIKEDIPYKATMVIIEMLNISDKKHALFPGKITGFCIVKNHISGERHKIHKDYNYNRFIYKATNRRIERNELTKYEELITKRLEFLCFRGSKHIKRSFGITLLPDSFIQYPCILQLFECLLKKLKER